MSKFVTIATRIKDVDCLREALRDMEAEVVDRSTVRGWRGQRRVDLAVVTAKGEMGFCQRPDGTFELVGDDMYVPDRFVEALTQRYARHKVLKEAAKAGFRVVEDKVQQDKSIRLVVRKW